MQRSDRGLDHPRQLVSHLVELRTDRLDQTLGQRIIGAHARQHVVDDPAVDPRQQIFRPTKHERLHQHQGRAQEQRQAACCRRRSASADVTLVRLVRKPSRFFTIGKHLADIHQGLGDALDCADKSNHRQEIQNISGQREPPGHLLLVEARALAVDFHELGHRRAAALLRETHQLADPEREDPTIVVGE